MRLAILAMVIGLAWLLWPFWRFAEEFAERELQQPSRLYGRPMQLTVGRTQDRDRLIGELQALGYRRTRGGRLERGEFSSPGAGVQVHLRAYPAPWGWNSGGLLEARWIGRRLAALSWRGEPIERITLEPPLLFTYYGADRLERRPTRLEDMPRDLIQAVLAAEDAGFFQHRGVSLRGMARAAWVNLRGGAIRQGGSTLTQQLVKNLYLSERRTVVRKLREALLALLIDWRFEKEQVLEAYLNEIYWGSSGGVNLMGVGAAAWAYFGKPPSQLTLCEAAVLAGMISSPGSFAPTTQPERSQARRDWVLRRMAELGWLQPSRLAAAEAEPLCVSPQPVIEQRAPYFGDRMATEAERRFGVRDLRSSGHVLLSTLDRLDQEAAETAVRWGLQALERGWEEASRASGPLQAALISLDPRSGAIAAYLGGRDYRQSQFDRVSQARRQAGSAFKPVVYAAAFEDRRVLPSTLIEDAPLTVAAAGREWSPQNSDSRFRGWVSVRTALEDSLNVPTARLALDVGLDRVVDMGRAMGIDSPLEPVPSLALGAFEVTALELARVYAVIASGGDRPEIYGLVTVLDAHGERLAAPTPQAARAMSAPSAFLLTSILQGVLDRGTGASVRQQGLQDRLAGKTGTTNHRRDSWFVGFSPDRVSLVWVGYDDNSPTRLSGARAALPIWARFTWKVRPVGGYPVFDQAAGIASAVIDPTSGQLATDECDQVLTEVFLEGTVPSEICRLHGGWLRQEDWRSARVLRLERRGPLRWLRRIFLRHKPPTGPPPD